MKLGLLILLVIMIVGCGGYGSNSMAPPKPAATPVISQLSPNNANSGGAAFPFEVDGTSFAANAVINFNGTAESTTFVSATKLTTTIPASAITMAGSVPVTVTNPGTPGGGPYGGGGTTPVTSQSMPFTINP